MLTIAIVGSRRYTDKDRVKLLVSQLHMTYYYLTTAEAAARAGVKRGTILAWLARGYLAGRKLGRDWRLLPTDVDRCAAGRHIGWPKGQARKVTPNT